MHNAHHGCSHRAVYERWEVRETQPFTLGELRRGSFSRGCTWYSGRHMLRSLTPVILRVTQGLHKCAGPAAAVCAEVTQRLSVPLLSSHHSSDCHDVGQPGIRMHHRPRNLPGCQHLCVHTAPQDKHSFEPRFCKKVTHSASGGARITLDASKALRP